MCLKCKRGRNDSKKFDGSSSFYDEAIKLIDLNDFDGAIKCILF